MSEFKGTPGPWEYRTPMPDRFYDWGWVTDANGQFIAQAKDPAAREDATLDAHRADKTDPWESNARLIAAAPELLEALEACRTELKVVKDGSVGGVPNSVVALIPEAIAKADAAISRALGEG